MTWCPGIPVRSWYITTGNMYINTHTYYSLRYGTLSPKQLVSLAVQNGTDRMALTDINNSTAMPEFVRLCRKHGIAPVAGMEFRQDNQLLYVVLARNEDGFQHINTFRSRHNITGTRLPQRFPVCEHTFAIYPSGKDNKVAEAIAGSGWHPNEYAGIRAGDLHRLYASPLRHHPGRLVVLHPVSFENTAGYALHLHLCAVRHNILLSRLKPQHSGTPGDVMLPVQHLKQQYAAFPHIINNTEKLLEACHIDFDFGVLKNKKSFTGQPADDRTLLEKLAFEGMKRRYGKNNKEAMRRIQNELAVISKLNFSSYFLITSDIVRYSMSRGFYHVGRGSGANSIVAYCLQITDVDPIALDLYFERFINPKRSTPPDFDIDYSWRDRDQVLAYIFKRYGDAHTALLGTISTFHHRSAVREMAKVYGLPKTDIDVLAASAHRTDENHERKSADLQDTKDGHKTARTETTTGNKERICEKVLHRARQLVGFPNLRSIHAGGVLISEKPVCRYAALDLPPKGLPTVQWDMYTAEDLGFEKIDILSQRGIGHINECIRIIKENHGRDVDIHRMELIRKDQKVKALLRNGKTTGCFYVESPAMRSLLQKLRCDDYPTLVAASSIIRPGVSRSGMMDEYIRRSHHPEKIQYLHPVMENQLKETYGVMVYQEDVIKVCHHFAGLGLADADVLRRAMSGKYRSKEEMQRLTKRFFEGCRTKGHPDHLAREVWRQIESFAGYSFSKAHSASFAAESFQSLYLKAHYPVEFMTAVINNFGGFYRSGVYFHEARKTGARIELPCVNRGSYLNTVEGNTIITGFVHIRNLEQQTAQQIVCERQQQGPFQSLEDFVRRTGIAVEQLVTLIRTTALRFTGIAKQHLLWQAYTMTGKGRKKQPTLFALPAKTFQLPEPESDALTDAYDELELLGFTLSMSPFELLQTTFRGEVCAKGMAAAEGHRVRMLGWLVTTKYVRTIRNETMYFGCFLDHQGDFFDTVHFPETARKYPFRGSGIYLMQGRITVEYNHPSLVVEKMARLPVSPDPREDVRPGQLVRQDS